MNEAIIKQRCYSFLVNFLTNIIFKFYLEKMKDIIPFCWFKLVLNMNIGLEETKSQVNICIIYFT